MKRGNIDWKDIPSEVQERELGAGLLRISATVSLWIGALAFAITAAAGPAGMLTDTDAGGLLMAAALMLIIGLTAAAWDTMERG